MGKQTDFIFLVSKITADGDCSHEMKRRLLLGRKVMTNLDSILKSRHIPLPKKVCLVKAMVFPVVMCGCESCTIKKVEHRRIGAFELWCWKRILRVPLTARRSIQSILKINPECSLERLMLKLKLQYFGHLMWRADSFEKTLMLGETEGRRRRGQQRMRWPDGITATMEMSLSKLGVDNGHGGLECCSPWGRKEPDTTELNWGPSVLCYLPELAQIHIHCQVPMQYCSLHHWTSFTTRHIHNWALFPLWPSNFILCGAMSKMALCSSPVAYWIPSNLGEGGDSSSSVIYFCLFITVHGILKARIVECVAISSSEPQ